MNNSEFQEKIDSVFDKFKTKLRSANPVLIAGVAAGATVIGLAALSAYDLAMLAEFTDFSQVSSVFEFTRDAFSLVGIPAYTVGKLTYQTVNLPKNIIICGDKEDGRKPEIDAAKPVSDGFISKLGRAAEKQIDYSNWDNKLFRGWLKGHIEDFKEVVRETSLENTMVMSVCALAAATVFEVLVLGTMSAPTKALEQAGGLASNYLGALSQVTEIFNNKVLLAVSAFSVFTGVRAGFIKGHNEKAAMKEINASQSNANAVIPAAKIIELSERLDGLDTANKRFLSARENLVLALHDSHLADEGAKAEKSSVLKLVSYLDSSYTKAANDLSSLAEAAQELKELDADSYTAVVSDKQEDAIESFLEIKDDDLKLQVMADFQCASGDQQAQKAQETLGAGAMQQNKPLDAFFSSKGYVDAAREADVNQKKDHGPRL